MQSGNVSGCAVSDAAIGVALRDDASESTTTVGADSEGSATGHEDQPEEALAPVCVPAFYIVGTWDDWASKQQMAWDGTSYSFIATLGSDGEESFQILKGGDWQTKLHPDAADANPHVAHSVKGPGDGGHGLNWTIGRHRADGGAPGKQYTVRLTIDGAVSKIDWVQIVSPKDEERVQKQMAEKEKAAKGRAEWMAKENAERAAQEELEKEASTTGAKADEEALQEYSQRFAEPVQGEFGKKAFSWEAELGECLPGQDVRAELEREMGAVSGSTGADSEEALEATADSSRCSQCGLPVGELAYEGKDGKVFHGECMAQVMVHTLREKEEANQREEAELKHQCRVEYDIGWKADRAPRNVGAAKKLTGQSVRQGMCCVVLDDASDKLCVAPTVEPATSVNLEYLSTALRVRLNDGREPLFSLDPVESTRNAMQFKRFEPAWLAGTSVGEVLFQSDYHLKELSMGEHEQPIVGMKSCLDFLMCRTDDWKAREWFVVRKAEVQLSQENVLIPYVRMGVEAREQVLGRDGLEDVKRSRPDHPLVKYAEAFTHNFELIAERKSVVYHLREVAKASVLAKFLIESEVELAEAWLELADEAKPACLEVPQLWNQRYRSQIQLEDGKILDGEKVTDPSKSCSVYGGVQFGLDKFNLAAPRAGLRATSMSIAASIRQAPGRQGFARAAISATTRLAPSVFPQSLRTAAPMARAAISATTRLAPSAFPQTLRTAAPMARAAISAQTRLAPSVFPSSLRTAAPMARAAISAQTRLAPSVFPSSLRTAAPMARAAISAQTRLAPSVFPSSLRTAAPMARAAISAQTRLAPSVFPSSLRTAAPMARAAISATTRLAPSVFPSSLRTAAPMARGVDLNLDTFDLAEAKRVELDGVIGDRESLDSCVAIGDAFWSSLEGTSVSPFKESHKAMLKSIFNPCLSDRRKDGDRFVPPDTRFAYVEKLRNLVKEEEMVQHLRKSHFFSTDFSISEVGPLFPASWHASFEIARGQACGSLQASLLKPRPDYKAEASVLHQALKTTAPAFDKSTEEGTRFRVYKIGSLELRTTQEHGGEEAIGAVFSTCSEPHQGSGPRASVQQQERVVKVTEYIEHAVWGGRCTKQHRCYVVLETELGSTILTEQLRNGTVAWEENSSKLEVRNSLAKVLRSTECRDAGVTVNDMKSYQLQASRHAARGTSDLKSKQYAQRAYCRASRTLA